MNNQPPNSTGPVTKSIVTQPNAMPIDHGGNQPAVGGVATVTESQGMAISSHTSMPAQPSRPTALATAAPMKKKTTPPPSTPSNPPTPSVSVPTPPPSVTPTNANASITSPMISQATTIASYPIMSTISAINDTTINQPDLMQPFNPLGSITTTQPSIEMNLSSMKKETTHASMVQNIHQPVSTNNTNANLMTNFKSSVNMMPTNMQSNLLNNIGMGNMNLNLQQNLGPALLQNQLENMMNTTQLNNIQNAHNMVMNNQQHSNGFSNIKRETSPSMMNNNGIPNLNMPLGISTVGSIFDPVPPMVSMPMQIPQLTVKKDERPQMTQAPPHKPMDAGAFFAEMNSLGMPVMSNHSNAQILPEKKMTPPDSKNSAANFASAFKNKTVEQNVKNASSWSSLAQASSPQSAAGSNIKRDSSRDSFLSFKKQAKEKQDRQRALLEQQEIRRQQKEQERLRQESERKREREDEDALEKVMKTVNEQQGVTITPTSRVEEIKVSTETDSSSPSHSSSQDRAAAERERQRLREQDRRRREANANKIDMNMQSDLMAAFEETL
ncbi:hypothetical protein KQX54_007699 [Cotesia glomerata]|uniref:Bromodomain protein 4 C-terminal domain-containing protein n=3 Tax=Cotesia glomerata TaxID=32391 RepID=A0AAV7J3T6_COTGL|nr:hypothetical protein KQX54_007699 [Cotesia glomerata]